MPHFPPMLRTLAVTVRPRRLNPSRTPGVLPPHALLPHLSVLSLTYGLPDTELESYFTAARMAPIANLPSLKHLSVTTINHSLEQVLLVYSGLLATLSDMLSDRGVAVWEQPAYACH